MIGQSPHISVTVGIVTYNTHIEVLRRALVSLKDSSCDAYIIVLCNSPDASYQRDVANLCGQLGATALSNRPNRGFGAGHNAIAEMVQTEWYVCCNPDIEVQPSTIETLIQSGLILPKSAILAPKILSPDGSIQKLARRHLTLTTWISRQIWRFLPGASQPYEDTFNYERTQELDFPSGAFFAIRTRLFKQLGGFDTRFFLYCEDADLARRASKLGVNYHVADTSVTHAWAQAWRRSPRAMINQMRSLVQYFYLHGWV